MVYVRAVGMVCPVGLSAPAACAAIRCDLNDKQELPYHDRFGEPIVGSQMPGWFEPGTPRTERIVRLAEHAIEDALRELGPEALVRHPLIVALASGLSAQQQRRVVHELAQRLGAQLGLTLDASKFGVVSEDSAGGYRALGWARELLEQRQCEACIVCAADSLIGARELLGLERASRLIGLDNSDGLIPGEAAACVVLTTSGRGSLAQLIGLGFGHEAATLSNDEPLRAQGLVEATRAALAEAGLGLHEVELRLADLTGESFFFKEQALLLPRVMSATRAEFPLWTCATSLGHTGAAAGLSNLLLSIAAHQRGYAPGPLALACAGSELGLRSALVLRSTLSDTP